MAFDIVRQIEGQKQLKVSEQSFCLDSKSWERYKRTTKFNWQTVKFEKKNGRNIPNEPGIYAFFIRPGIANFPEHAYLMYIGKAGDKSGNTLRKRFYQYLNGMKRASRPKLNWFLSTWHTHLFFCFTEIKDKRLKLANIERDLNDAFIPPYNEFDFSAEVRPKVRVLR